MVVSRPMSVVMETDDSDVLPLPISDKQLPPAIGHDCKATHEVPDWSEAADWDVTLLNGMKSVCALLYSNAREEGTEGKMYFVLNGFIAARGR